MPSQRWTDDPRALVERYVELWMEPDPAARRRRVEAAWAPDGQQLLQLPAAMRETARALGFPHATLAVRGHDALEFRVARAHEEFVASGRCRFRACGDAVRVGDAVKFRWEMRSTADGALAGAGTDVLLLDEGDRIRLDYQFIDG